MTVEKQAVTARVPQDTFERLEQYRDKRNISRSDAARRIMEEGLDVLEDNSEEEQSQPEKLSWPEAMAIDMSINWRTYGIYALLSLLIITLSSGFVNALATLLAVVAGAAAVAGFLFTVGPVRALVGVDETYRAVRGRGA